MLIYSLKKMQRIFWFLYTYRAFISFVLLEIFCGWLIVRNNAYQGALFFNSSNRYTAQVLQQTQAVNDFFNLRQTNRQLAEENARLRQLYQQTLLNKPSTDPADYQPDSTLAKRFRFITAKVIKNSTLSPRNYITIDQGTQAGIQRGMGVISPQGVVGKVTACSEHFSVITSLLHVDYEISSQIKKSGSVGTVRWPGDNAQTAQMKYVPRYVEVSKGDTVVTSSYNSVFPEGILVGIVNKARVSPGETAYDLEVQLATDFNRLSFVYIVNNIFKSQQDSLETRTIPQNPNSP